MLKKMLQYYFQFVNVMSNVKKFTFYVRKKVLKKKNK